MAGERLEHARITDRGLAGDRRWALIDSAANRAGRPLTGRQLPALLGYAAHFNPERVGDEIVNVRAPDGRLLSMPEVQDELERLAGRSLALRDGHGGNYDDSHLLLLNLASLDRLASEHGAALDRRRFRANVCLDGLEVDEEYSWVGRRLLLGTAVVEAVKMCERCVMITIDPDFLSTEPAILRTLTRSRQALMGVYCQVVSPGVVRLNDSVELV